MSALTSILKIKYPIVQAPTLGVTSAAMVAAVSWAGQSAGKSYEASTGEIITRLITQLS